MLRRPTAPGPYLLRSTPIQDSSGETTPNQDRSEETNQTQDPSQETTPTQDQSEDTTPTVDPSEESTTTQDSTSLRRQCPLQKSTQASPDIRRAGPMEFAGRPFSVDSVGRFDPKKDDARAWLERYIYIGGISKTSPSQLAQCFGLFLTLGSAFDWFISLSEDIKEDFELLKTQFLRRFSQKVDLIHTTSEIFQMKQSQNQKVKDFVYEVENKALKAGIAQDTIFSAIHCGLLPHIRADLIRNPPSNLDELLKTSEQSESAHELNPPQANLSATLITGIVRNALGNVNLLDLHNKVENLMFTQNSVNAVEATPSNIQNYVEQRSNTRSTFKSINSKCTACGDSKLHQISKCWAKSKTCYFCNKQGHIQKACFHWLKANNR